MNEFLIAVLCFVFLIVGIVIGRWSTKRKKRRKGKIVEIKDLGGGNKRVKKRKKKEI